MSIQNIKLVLEHIDYSNHCQRIRYDITRLNSWLVNPRTLNERKMYLFYRTTGRNIEKKFISKHINDFQFLLMHIIKNPNSSRFNDLKNYYKLTDDELQTLKFLLYPKKFAPGGFNTDLKRYNIEFYSADAVLKKLGFKDYIDLYALMKFVPYDADSPIIKNFLNEVLCIDPLKTKKNYFMKVKEFYLSFSELERQIIDFQLSSISYYHYRLLSCPTVRGVVIDGSNVIRYKSENKLQRLLDLIDNLFIDDMIFLPAVIVFDKNIEYVLDVSERESFRSFVNDRFIYFNSPADDLILSISKKFDYYIVSNDKFKEYKANQEKILEIRRFLDV